MNTQGSIALVTGASSGIGEATALRLAAAGYKVYGSNRRGTPSAHPSFEMLALDVTDDASVDAAVAEVIRREGRIDLLVNNAGLAQGTRPAQDALLSDWKTMIDTNVTALVTLTHALLPVLIARRGAIINVSSTAATYPYPGGNAYGGSKAFVSQFSLGLRADLHGTGVRVTTLEPGMAETEFTLVRTHGDQAASDALYRDAEPMTADDIAGTIFWIATLPPHLNVNRLELMPTRQSFAGFQVHRG